MKTIKKRFIDLNDKTLSVEVYYNLGWNNWYSWGITKRGYYISFALWKSENWFFSYSPQENSCFKMMIKEVARKNNKDIWKLEYNFNQIDDADFIQLYKERNISNTKGLLTNNIN